MCWQIQIYKSYYYRMVIIQLFWKYRGNWLTLPRKAYIFWQNVTFVFGLDINIISRDKNKKSQYNLKIALGGIAVVLFWFLEKFYAFHIQKNGEKIINYATI